MGEVKQRKTGFRKRWGTVFISILCMGLLAGCQETPEDTIVRQKKSDNIKKYESNEEHPEEKQETEEEQGNPEEKKENVKRVLETPERYKNQASYQNGNLVIDTDAEILVPEGDHMNTYKVTAQEMNQELIDKITQAFFEGDKIYQEYGYFQWTKEQYQQDITMLKKFKAEGNLDPYNLGTYEDGSKIFDIDSVIEYDEENMKTAPDEIEKIEVTPSFGLEWVEGYGEEATKRVDDNRFSGAVETDNGVYTYTISGSDGYTADVRVLIQKTREDMADFRVPKNWWDGRIELDNEYISKEEGKQPSISEETIQNMLNISYEDAEKTAREKIDRLGWDWEITDWDYSLLKSGYDNLTEETLLDVGYVFYFGRVLDGIPVTFTDSYGGAWEDADSTLVPWSYERCEVIVGDDGIQKVEIYNPYHVEGIETENVKLMDFDSVMQIYEQMMEISNSDILQYAENMTYHVNKIQLGYTRIYDPTVESTTGIMVPVWDVFGGSQTEYEDHTEINTGEHSRQSMLTINALDGTIIDRGLGY